MDEEQQSEVSFMSVDEFKEQIGASTLEVLKNPKTGKLFMSAAGATYKVQQDINSKEDMRILVPEEGGISEACLINTSGGAEQQFII